MASTADRLTDAGTDAVIGLALIPVIATVVNGAGLTGNTATLAALVTFFVALFLIRALIKVK